MSEGSLIPELQPRALRTTAVLAWLRMAHIVGRTHRAAAERLRGLGISNAQFDVIAQVGAGRGLTQQELADHLLVTQGNVCQLIDGLEKRGLVKRQREGRSNRLFLTTEGQELFNQAVPEHEVWQAERMSALSTEEQQHLLRLLRKLDRAQK
jgi:DNA-binding MarR family transcriptional regulator